MQNQVESLSIAPSVLADVVDDFKDLINSKRLQSRIGQLNELIHILFKRDLFASSRDTLSLLLSRFPEHDDKSKIINYVNYLTEGETINDTVNVYAEAHPQPANEPVVTKCVKASCQVFEPMVEPPVNNTQMQSFLANKEQIYSLIVNGRGRELCGIGAKWQFLARRLGLTNQNDLQMKVFLNGTESALFQLLDEAEKKHRDNFENYPWILCTALREVGRNDLANQIKKKFDIS